MQDDDIKKKVLQDDAVKEFMAQLEHIKNELRKTVLIAGLFLSSDNKKSDNKKPDDKKPDGG